MDSKTLYLECYSGISGDMAVAALLDLGADEAVLRTALSSLKITGYEIEISRVKKAGLDVCDFHVKLDADHENHDHDMDYLHGNEQTDEHSHEHGRCTYEHCHKHHHAHEHRGLTEILDIIYSGTMTRKAKDTAEKIFCIIAEAESKAHGVPASQVHFHEVGAVDSIVDIVAAAVCLDNLGIEQVIVPRLNEGYGTIRCQHGMIPVPVPAVCHIAEAHDLHLHMVDVEGELVTPTGAAIVAAICTSKQLPDGFAIEKIGMGAGKRAYAGATGILRAMLIRADGHGKDEQKADEQNRDVVYKLESNIDDSSGEILGYVMDRLFEAGARDVNYMPIYMKKNRPAYQLNVICGEEHIPLLEQIIFEETTTIGIRRQKMERTILEREVQEIETCLGTAQIKICRAGANERAYPEYKRAAALAKANKMPLQEVYRAIEQAWEQNS